MKSKLEVFLDKFMNGEITNGQERQQINEALEAMDATCEERLKAFVEAQQTEWADMILASRKLGIMIPVEVVMEILAVYFSALRMVFPDNSDDRALVGLAAYRAAEDTRRIAATHRAGRKPLSLVAPILDAMMDATQQVLEAEANSTPAPEVDA